MIIRENTEGEYSHIEHEVCISHLICCFTLLIKEQVNMTLLGYSMEPNLHVCSLVKIVETVLVTLTESCEKSSVLMQDKGDLKNVEPQ